MRAGTKEPQIREAGIRGSHLIVLESDGSRLMMVLLLSIDMTRVH